MLVASLFVQKLFVFFCSPDNLFKYNRVFLAEETINHFLNFTHFNAKELKAEHSLEKK